MNQRIYSIDILKLFAMWLVIWGHMLQFLLSSHYLDEPAFVYIYSFHLPLFMMLSGFFAGHALELPIGQFVWKKFKQLLLPCFTWGTLMSLGNMIQPFINGVSVDKTIFSTFITNFWFLKSLFLCFILAYIGKLCVKKEWLYIPITIIASQWIPIYSVEWMYPSFIIGVLGGSHYDEWRSHSLKISAIALPLFLICLIGWGKYVFTDSPSILYLRLYRHFTGIIGSIGLIASALWLEQRWKFSPNNILARCGQLTLGIYILQTFIFIIHNRFCPIMYDHISPLLFNLVIAPLGAMIILVVCSFGTWIISKIPIIKTLMLGYDK